MSKGATEITPEMRLKQQNDARLDLRERLEEDSKITKMNQLKVNNQWRKIMRLAKTEALKSDIEILSQNHERNLDRKDALLHMLIGDMQDAEAQFQLATRSHLLNIDKLVKINDDGLKELQKMYQKHVELIQKTFREEMVKLHDKFDKEKKALQVSVESIDGNEDEKKNDSRQSFEQQREEIRNHNVEDINMLRITLDSQIEELEQQFETAHLNYMQQTGQRTHEYKDLAQNDKLLTEDIEKKRKKIDALQMLLLQWRGKTRQLVEDSDERRRMLISEKRTMQLHYQQLKNRIKSYRDLQNQRLLHLSACAGACELKLKNKLEVAKSILSLAELTKLDKEKMTSSLSFVDGGSSLDSVDDELQQLMRNSKGYSNNEQTQQFRGQNSFTSSLMCNKDKLDGFYNMYNRVLLETVEVEKQRAQLQAENQQLSELIAQYNRAKSLDATSLDSANTLFIVNGRTDINEELAMVRMRNTVSQPNSWSTASRTAGGGRSSRSLLSKTSAVGSVQHSSSHLKPEINGKMREMNLTY